MPCVFCGFPTVTGEHVIPGWIRREFPQAGPVSVGIRTTDIGDTRRQQSLFSEEVRRVCQEECNGGWMSRLETAAAPALRPLIAGQHATLNPDALHVIAKWATKTAMMASYLRPAHPIPAGRLKSFYETGEPPRYTVVWIGTHAMTATPCSYRRQALDLSWSQIVPSTGSPSKAIDTKDANAYAVTISIYRFVFRVLAFVPDLPDYEGAVRLDVTPDPVTDGLIPIWPNDGNLVIHSPTRPALDEIAIAGAGAPRWNISFTPV